MSGPDLRRVLGTIDAHRGETNGRLKRLCRQPSMSAQSVGLDEMVAPTRDVLAQHGVTQFQTNRYSNQNRAGRTAGLGWPADAPDLHGTALNKAIIAASRRVYGQGAILAPY